MAGVKRLKIFGDAAVIGNENNDVTINDRTLVRVTINGKDTVWERPNPNHKWSFNEESGDFVDSENGKVIQDTDIAQRVSSMHAELGQAIELDAGFEVLTSDLYPLYSADSVSVSGIELDFLRVSRAHLDGLSVSNFVMDSVAVVPVLVEYEDAEAEGVAIDGFTLDDVTVYGSLTEYMEGDPEGVDLSFSFDAITVNAILIDYEDGEAEGVDLSFALDKTDLIQTVSLLNFNGTDASTTITEGADHLTWTASGNAQLDTSEFKFGTASLQLDGSGDYIETTNNAVLDLGSATDFTIEAWIKLDNFTNNYQAIVANSRASWGTGARSLNVHGDSVGNSRKLVFSNFDSTPFVSTNTLSPGVWHHVALTRENDQLRLFIDGNLEATRTEPDAMNFNLNNACRVGWGEWDGANGYFDGHIDDFRLIKGVALYTSSFTPPSTELGIY